MQISMWVSYPEGSQSVCSVVQWSPASLSVRLPVPSAGRAVAHVAWSIVPVQCQPVCSSLPASCEWPSRCCALDVLYNTVNIT